MLATLIIVFREALEAGLIIGIVLAATRGVPGRGRWVTLGLGGGALGACLVAMFARELSRLFEGSGQELFNAGVLLLAVGMLIWHNVWMAGHGREMSRQLSAMGTEVKLGARSLAALAVVIGVAVLREGSEVVLFLYGVAAQGGSTAPGMLGGGALGLLAGAAVSALLYFGLLAIPMKRLFAVTGALITMVAAGLAVQAVAFLQQGGLCNVLETPLWDTSGWLPEDTVAGRVLKTLLGYTDRPDGLQLGAWSAVILLMIGLARLVRWHRSRSPLTVAVPGRR
ncbi:MAG TPA: FTR1 family protein [Steroidobacteraceae bacterium]|nr:FTR1 family protein [Steroidobacteraceae bacterium]